MFSTTHTLPVMLAAIPVGALAGWMLRQIFSYPRHFQRAERAWMTHRPTHEVLVHLAHVPLATGELGYQVECLRGRALLACGRREEAWRAMLRAQIRRAPFWARPILWRFLARPTTLPATPLLARGSRLLRRFPHMAHLHHRMALLHQRLDTPDHVTKAWDHLVLAVPLATPDPLLLETLMLTALQQWRKSCTPPIKLGKQDLPPRLAYVFEESLALLRQHHGDARLDWDRVTPAKHLMKSGKVQEALSLVRTIPSASRSATLREIEVFALQTLGNLEETWMILEESLDSHPTSFRLWMSRHQVAMARHQQQHALTSLEMARACLPAGDDSPDAYEWRMRRAEHAYFHEQNPGLAWELIQSMPTDHASAYHPPLRLQVMVTLARYEDAYQELSRLIQRRPGDAELLLLQAKCMAGMETWEPLLPLLDHLPDAARVHPAWWHLRGLALSHAGMELPARESLEQAARMNPGDPETVMDAAHACMDLGEHERAEHHWRQALKLDPVSEEALVNLAEVRRMLHDPESAKRFLRECLLHHPESESAQNGLAELESN